MKRKMIIPMIFFLMLSGCTNNEDHTDEKQKNQYDPSLIATVKDLTAPVILCSDSYTVIKDTAFDIKDKIKVTDNNDKSPALSIEGKIDTKKTGNYQIKISAKDKDGNITNKSITIEVIDKAESKQEEKEQNKGQQNNAVQSNHAVNTTNGNENQAVNNSQEDKQFNSSSNDHPNLKELPQERDFMFTDGKTFNDTYNDCMSAGQSMIEAGTVNYVKCSFFEDENGIAIGYHLFVY